MLLMLLWQLQYIFVATTCCCLLATPYYLRIHTYYVHIVYIVVFVIIIVKAAVITQLLLFRLSSLFGSCYADTYCCFNCNCVSRLWLFFVNIANENKRKHKKKKNKHIHPKCKTIILLLFWVIPKQIVFFCKRNKVNKAKNSDASTKKNSGVGENCSKMFFLWKINAKKTNISQ